MINPYFVLFVSTVYAIITEYTFYFSFGLRNVGVIFIIGVSAIMLFNDQSKLKEDKYNGISSRTETVARRK